MIAYLCDSCGLPLSGNNGEAIFLTLFTKENKEYKIKITPELDHYHQDCVIDDLCIQNKTKQLQEIARRPKGDQFFPLGEWKTDTGVKVNLRFYDKLEETYTALTYTGDTVKFNIKGESFEVGKLKTRSEEEEW